MARWGIVAPNRKATDHFSYRELACRCCGRIVSLENALALAVWLERIRREYDDRVIHVASAHRCPTHNRNVGGATFSEHPKGNAADIVIRGLSPLKVWTLADERLQPAGIVGGLGSYPAFTHIDKGRKRDWNDL